MIVPCSQCHTRFKVPDHRVTARGVKVRCSRCGHTFRVFPEAPPPAGDPFAAFGPLGTSDLEKTPARGTAVAELLAQLEAKSTSDDFDVDDSGEAPPLPEPAWSFPPAPTPRSEGAGEAVAVQAAEPIRPALPVRPLPAPAFAEPLAPAEGRGALEPAAEALPKDPPPFSADLASLAGFTPAWGVAAPQRALGTDGMVSHHQARLDAQPSEPIVAPPPPPPAPMLGDAGTMLDDLPSLEDLGPATESSLELDRHPGGDGWSGEAPLGHAASQFDLPQGSGSVELDRPEAPPASEAGSGRTSLDWDESLSSSAHAPAEREGPTTEFGEAFSPGLGPSMDSPAPASDLFGDPFASPPELPAPATDFGGSFSSSGRAFPGGPPPSSEFGDPFGEPVTAAAPTPSVELDDARPFDPSKDHGLFEMSRPGPPAPTMDGPLLPDIPEMTEPVPAPGGSPTGSMSGPFPLGRLSRPPGRTRLGLDDRGEPGTARRVSGFLLNLGIAGLLLVVVGALGSGYLSEGRMELSMLSPQRWLAAIRTPSGVSPTDVTNGTYETRSGRSLLYVRGRVVNRGAPDARVRVEAELWDGGRRVKTSDTVAGASASPEELWMAGSPAEVEALRQRLLSQAKGVPQGAGADFLVLFDEVPSELGSVRLRVLTSVDRR